MLPEAFVSHQTNNRLRIRIPLRKKNTLFLSGLQEKLMQLDGVDSVSVSEVTGNVLITHRSDKDTIRRFAENRGLFLLKEIEKAPSTLHQKVTGAFDDVNVGMKRTTGGELDIPSIAFLVLLGMGGYQVSRGNFTAPAWYTAWWYALNIFLKAG